ncbi:uncharacterized protein LOC134529494 [Bacillus rossius redtenbacheri]|uniref:uncharacterized protein LOC134529494 n=1 Tax=Bacillus rossius redtenbacheri TaxID=93214 RepID=UPI002FDD2421
MAPVTSAARTAKMRAEMKSENTERWAEYLKKDRERNWLKRQAEKQKCINDKKLLNTKREKTRLRVQEWRKKKRLVTNICKEPTNLSALGSYTSTSTLRKAVHKARKNLPNSPTKKQAVVRQLMKESFSTPEDELFKAQKFLAPRGKLYRKEDLETARNFFENDDISWQTSGKRDCITVKNEVTGKKEKKQKRFLMMSVVEAHQKFSELYPEIHISRSKFFEMRPKHVKPIKDTPHNVCVCIKHSNFRFLAEAISPFCIGYQGNSLTPTSLIQIMCCNTHEERCMTNKCSVCHYDVKSLLEPHSDFSREVKWNKWIKTEGQLVVEKVSSSLQNLVTQLNTYIPNFKKHVFVKCEQARYFEDKKNNLRKGEAVMQVDFAENYSIISQDEVQSAHWQHSQVTIFTCCLWFEDMAFSYVVVSDDVSHSKQSAWTFIKTIISHFQQNPNVSLCDLIIFSDNCSSQFKSKYTVFNMCFLADDLNVKTVEWNFFAAGHGKGAVDTIGGQVKRMVWTTVKARRTTVNNAGEFFNVAQAQCKSTEVLYVSK